MDKIKIIKISGNVIDDKKCLNSFLKDFAKITGSKILVHGGGILANKLMKKLDLEPVIYNGRRITDAKALEIVVMIYSGLINKNIVANLQKSGNNAIGLSGCDANLITAIQRPKDPIDFGYVGDITPDHINTKVLKSFLESELVPVIAPITHDNFGVLLNTNADTIASNVAIALSDFFDVELYFCFDKDGVLTSNDEGSEVLTKIDFQDYQNLLLNKQIHDGMLPKLENAYFAKKEGVPHVVVCHYKDVFSIAEKGLSKGTLIV